MRSIANVIQAISANYPHNIAVEYRGKKYSYFTMNNQSNKMAVLLADILPEDRKIMMLMNKNANMVISILGIWKAGGIFIPIQKEWPLRKRESVQKCIQAHCIITEAEFIDQIAEWSEKCNINFHVIVIGNDRLEEKQYPKLKIWKIKLCDDGVKYPERDCYYDACYIYHTSGSTAEAKSILGSQRSLLHFIHWEISQFKVDRTFRISLLTNVSFDPFLRDMLVPLCAGATLCIPDSDEIILNQRLLKKWIQEEKIVLVHMVPTLFKELGRECSNNEVLENLKYILLAGESLKGIDVQPFYKIFGTRIQLVNLYGPTETTLAKCFYYISPEDGQKVHVPIGDPIPDTEIIIQNDNGVPCEQGESGEIYIKTKYPSLGYYHNEKLNQMFFVHSNDDTGIVIYKTGDIGRYLPNGKIECLGRNDSQVKIRGMKVNLSEVEKVLNEYQGISNGVVVCKSDSTGSNELVGYYTSDKQINMSKLYEYLSREMPHYMIPAYLFRIESLPKLLNGKIDRKYLKGLKDKVELENLQEEKPVSAIQIKLHSFWKQILNTDNISIHSNFFFIGGHSLKAMVLANHIKKEFSVEIKAADIFRLNTIADQEKYIISTLKIESCFIPAADDKEEYMSSPAELRIYLADMLSRGQPVYNMPTAIKVNGKLDVQRVENVMQKLADRHEALRTNFIYNGQMVMQRIAKKRKVPFCFFEWTKKELSEKEKEKIVQEKILEWIKPFDLQKDMLFRGAVLKLSQEEFVLFWDMHHAVSDGMSEEILKDEFTNLYNGEELQPVKLQYKDFSEWIWKGSKENMSKEASYWKNHFKNSISGISLPMDFTRKGEQSFQGEQVSAVLEKDICKKMELFCRRYETTEYLVMLTAFYIFLSKYSGQEDIVIGTVESGRGHIDLERIVGVFINTIAIRNYPKGDLRAEEFLKQVQTVFLDILKHHNTPFEDVVKMIHVKREANNNPLFNVMFIFQNMEFSEMKLKNAKTVFLPVNRKIAKYDITLTVFLYHNKMILNFEYCTELFLKSSIKRMAECYVTVLNQILDHAEKKIREIELLNKESKYNMLKISNGITTPFSKLPVHELFEQSVEKNPYKTALYFQQDAITYLELNQRANRLAHYLADKNVIQGSIVGILLKRSMDMIVAILAVLKAGGAYLPIDPTYPDNRIKYMLEDSQCKTLITDEEIKGLSIKIIKVNDPVISDFSSENLGLQISNKSLSYVIYTSGSTGNPKGVMIEHRNEVNFIEGMCEQISFSKEDVILCLTTISFDIFVLETMLPLVQGMSIVIASEQQQLDIKQLGEMIQKYKVNMMQITPSRLGLFLAEENAKDYFTPIHTMIIGGEPLKEKIVTKLKDFRSDLKIYNMYGPTETCVWSSIKKISFAEPITIGRGIKNTRLYILDKYRLLQPAGVPGELYIGGAGVVRGYLYNEQLTKERFVDNPFVKGERIYCTGDRAKWNENNEIVFCGRIDNQVKVRGYRVELSEIEKCILKNSQIKNCVCILSEDEKTDSNYILAYYVSEKEIEEEDLYHMLISELPFYMIPKMYIWLKEMPMTPNGKIDKNSLPIERKEEKDRQYGKLVAANETELAIINIWAAVLGRKSFTVQDNFFEVGGNSLLLVKMYYEINKLYPDVLSVEDIFSNPTIRMISETIMNRGNGMIELQSVRFPEEYRANELGIRVVVLERIVTGDLYQKLLKAVMETHSSAEEILFSLYAYLLGSVTGYRNIPIQKLEEGEKGWEIVINLQNALDYLSLIKICVKAFREKNKSYLFKNVKSRDVKEEVTAGYIYQTGIEKKYFDMVDFCLYVKENVLKKDLKVILAFNSARVQEEQAEQLLDYYMQILALMLSDEK